MGGAFPSSRRRASGRAGGSCGHHIADAAAWSLAVIVNNLGGIGDHHRGAYFAGISRRNRLGFLPSLPEHFKGRVAVAGFQISPLGDRVAFLPTRSLAT